MSPARILVSSMLVSGLILTGCATESHATDSAESGVETSQEQAPPQPAMLDIQPAPSAVGVNIHTGVSANIEGGTFTELTLTNPEGNLVPTQISADGKSWKPTVPLGYGRGYTLAGRYVQGDARLGTTPLTFSRSFTTMQPEQIMQVSLNSSGNVPLGKGRTYGVGMVISAEFSTAVTDKLAVEKHIKITTSPQVEGAWYWIDDTTAHWRPREYYPVGTTVNIDANIFGKDFGDGVWGGDDNHADFTVGRRMVAIVDNADKHIVVYENQKEIRRMPTSMGKGGRWGDNIHFWTQAGVYTVLDKAQSIIMDSSSYGLPVSSGEGYRTLINNATRISNDGIYLHTYMPSVWAQGSQNVSHGCLNLNDINGRWVFDNMIPGDVVDIRGTAGPKLLAWQNGGWSVPWAEWKAGNR